jgi:hypothetical protein
MKILRLNARDARQLHGSGGYSSVRALETVVAVVELTPDLPTWATFIAPIGTIWGMRFPVSDLHGAKEGAVLRDVSMQSTIRSLLPVGALHALAPPSVVESCTARPEKSVHSELWGYYHLSAYTVDKADQAMRACAAAEAWISRFRREVLIPMEDSVLEREGWLSARAASEDFYALLLYAAPAMEGVDHGVHAETIIAALEETIKSGVSLNALRLDPRFLRMPKFALGLTNAALGLQRLSPPILRIAELRATLVERLESPLLFDVVAAEAVRCRDEYASVVPKTELERIGAHLENYLHRWRALLANAEIF